MTRASQSADIPPVWTSVLVVIAHPDDESVGLGAILDAFSVAGARVEVLCLTHGEVWTLTEAPGDLAELRGTDLVAADVLGVVRATLPASPVGALSEVSQTRLAAEVVAAADSCHPDGILVFDTAAVTGHIDDVAAASAALLAAETLGLPLLGWTLPETVAAPLNARLTDLHDNDTDLRVALERARHRLAHRAQEREGLPGSTPRRRLELLADTASLRWLRRPKGAAVTRPRGDPDAPDR